jgi:hypothetical protein
MDFLAVHPQLDPESYPIQSDPAMVGRPRDMADERSELAQDFVDRRLQAAPRLFETLSVLH